MTNSISTVTKELESFHFCFQLSRKVIFEVNYYRCGNNTNKYFSTSAAQFNQPKTDFNHCGQAQEELCKGHSKAMQFYKKWDILHLQDLTVDQYEEMIRDIEVLKNQYNYIKSETDLRFWQEKDLSMMPVKKLKR